MVQDLTMSDVWDRGLLVSNRLSANTSAGPGRLNSYDFEAQSARVRITFPDPSYPGATIERTVPASGLVGQGSNAPLGLQIFTPEITTLLRAVPLAAGKIGTVRVAIRLDGNFLDGSGVQTTEREYVIGVCQGCIGAPGACTTGTRQKSCSPGSSDDSNVCQ